MIDFSVRMPMVTIQDKLAWARQLAKLNNDDVRVVFNTVELIVKKDATIDDLRILIADYDYEISRT